MRVHILYVASHHQVELTKQSLRHLNGVQDEQYLNGESFHIKHDLLAGIELSVHLLSSLDAITGHLRHAPVDLLIYDEQNQGIDAIKAVEQIQDDVEALATLWGSDFHFPMGRVLVILEGRGDFVHKTFQLGRYHVKDVLVAPKNLGRTLRWLTKLILAQKRESSSRVGVAMSGGGMEGCLYQIGCSLALQRALKQRAIQECDVFSGVSSGSIVSALLAAKIPLTEIVLSIFGKSKRLPKFDGSVLYDLATFDITRRIGRQALSWSGIDPNRWWQKAMRSIPTGFFKGDSLKAYMLRALREFEAPNRFQDLDCELYIGGTLQDTFAPVVFGKEPWDKVFISEAVRASCALPPVFTPAEIDGKKFIDGQITKTSNLELVIRRGCKLVFVIDPLIPYTPQEGEEVDELGGVFTIIQTIKTLVHTRFKIFLTHLTDRFPEVDFIVFQPTEECAKAMSGSPMKYKINPEILALSYVSTLRRLRERYPVYAAKLSKYGFEIVSQRELLDLERNGLAV